MPTGYTAQLQEMNYDTAKWIKESVSRAFGMCIIMRDDGYLPEQEILNKLSGEDCYYSKELKSAQEKLESYKKMSNEDLAKELEALKLEKQQYREKSVKKFNEEKIKHQEVLSKINLLIALNPEEATLNVLNFAKDQLEKTLDFDYKKCYAMEPNVIESMDTMQYRFYITDKLYKDISRYSEELKKEETRNLDRLNAYKDLINFVDQNINRETNS